MDMTYDTLLEDLMEDATKLSQEFVHRDTFKEVYLGGSSPVAALEYIHTAFFEVVAYYAYCLRYLGPENRMSTTHREEVVDNLRKDIPDPNDAGLMDQRIKQYQQAQDSTVAFGQFCFYALLNYEFAPNLATASEEENIYGYLTEQMEGMANTIQQTANSFIILPRE